MKDHPIEDTLWMRCFLELLPVKKAEGAATLEFSDVDDLVLEKAKMPTPELLKFLGHNVKVTGF